MPDQYSALLETIATVGRDRAVCPDLTQVEPLRHFFGDAGDLRRDLLDVHDGACTRRDVLLRYLLLSAVLDQGPDIQGIRALLAQVTNDLYRREVRFLHRPLAFFEDLGIAVDSILLQHEGVKTLRAQDWAIANQSQASKYNLFMDNCKQALNYAVFRWGTPLAVPLMLERDLVKSGNEGARPTALADYLERWKSAEIMSQQLKDHSRYGLGKAVGDKACHLFAKWMVSTYCLSRRRAPGWDDLSYELPYDSNAGRLLWRTGYLLRWATVAEYKNKDVIQENKGKGGTDYIRVTNIREMRVTQPVPPDLVGPYRDVVLNHLKTRQRFSKYNIHEMQHAYLAAMYDRTGLGVADLDDGLIYIGTTYCYNHSEPRCDACPIGAHCAGRQGNIDLIEKYRT
jgi:hypothetical protein